MDNKELLKGTADFNINRNDMFWHSCILDCNNFEFYHVRLSGYNDDFWWDNVSEKASIISCKGTKGTEKKFKLNYKTLDVVEIE